MTGAGAPGAAGIIKCLLQDASVNLTIADADPNAIGQYLHPHFVTIPKGSDENFITTVKKICTGKGIQVVMPLVTRELFPFSAQKKELAAAGIKVLVSSGEAIQIANNKSACYAHLQKAGIVVPDFRIVSTVDEFIEAAKALGYPGKKFCFKPSISNGSRGFRIVADDVNEADQLFNYKPYNTYITYHQAIKILSSQVFPELLVSEYLPGDEYSVDCLADDGKPYLIVPRRREKMVAGISVQGTFIEDKTIIDYCAKIIEAIGLHGNIGIQVKVSDDGVPLLLEINPRVQGTIVSALGAGVNLPLLAVKKELGMPITANEMQVAWGTRFSRYWAEVYY